MQYKDPYAQNDSIFSTPTPNNETHELPTITIVPKADIQLAPIITEENTSTQKNIFNVYANKGWQDTGIIINQGDNVEIKYLSGKWTSEDSTGVYFGPSTNKAENSASCRPIPDWDAALIGKIGMSSSPFIIGYSYSKVSSNTGNLYLRMNDCDDWLGDNDGYLQIQILKK